MKRKNLPVWPRRPCGPEVGLTPAGRQLARGARPQCGPAVPPTPGMKGGSLHFQLTGASHRGQTSFWNSASTCREVPKVTCSRSPRTLPGPVAQYWLALREVWADPWERPQGL